MWRIRGFGTERDVIGVTAPGVLRARRRNGDASVEARPGERPASEQCVHRLFMGVSGLRGQHGREHFHLPQWVFLLEQYGPQTVGSRSSGSFGPCLDDSAPALCRSLKLALEAGVVPASGAAEPATPPLSE